MIIEKRQKFTVQDAAVQEELLENDPDFMTKFARIYQNYDSAMKIVCTQLEIWDNEFASANEHSPVHHMECRIKSPDSLIAKMKRKGYELSVKSIPMITDIAGIRVVCNYTNDIYSLCRLIQQSGGFRIIRKKDYTQAPKQNGYRSLHLVIGVTVITCEGTIELPVEIQLRSIAMDLWASLEHELRYKSGRVFLPEDEQRLKQCADTLSAVDFEMQDMFLHNNAENIRKHDPMDMNNKRFSK